jgi:Fe(3+) dicitrate transport protein
MTLFMSKSKLLSRLIVLLLIPQLGWATPDSPATDPFDEPIGPDILDEPIGPDILDEPIGPDILDEPKQLDTQPSIVVGQKKERSKTKSTKKKQKVIRLKKVSIIGSTERLSRVSGSAHQIKEEELEAQNYDDVHRVLKQIPGVYVRDEDGQGLRPNIGLRGANSDRSAKVTLMEDGVLMAPAPYSAPAAYYFPLTTRLTAVEVFKGPASIQYGPQTIGGALNMSTRRTPLKGMVGSLDGSFGQYQTRKIHSYLGWGNERMGFLLEGVHFGSDGFKELDGGGNTGFDKSEVMFKTRVNSDPDANVFQQLDLKLGWAIERSNETYLGLSEPDFEATPYRRYLASELAEMAWDRLQGQLKYTLLLGDDVDLSVTGYRHQFSRAWEKMNGFNNSVVSFEEVLADPFSQRNRAYYELLTGQSISTTSSDQLRLGLNDRTYLSQGLQLSGRYRQSGEGWKNQIQMGFRVHYDQINRNHSERLVDVEDGGLKIESDRVMRVKNQGKTLAFSAFAFDEVRLGSKWRLTPGVRLERYSTGLADLNGPDEVSIKGSDWILLPGIGMWYTVSDHWGILAGAHRGFSPLSLSQTGQTNPEESINYEAGTRWLYPDFSGEAILFLNDYKNLVGTCTQSAGCQVEQLDQQFNAGSALIYGAEFTAEHQWRLASIGQLRGQLSYTYTHGRFQDAFRSGFAQWGDVEAGYALPYVPEHQASIKLTWRDLNDRWSIGLSDTLVSSMLDQAGVYGDGTTLKIAPQHILDAHAHYAWTKTLQSYLTIDNILNTAYMTSRRPFGVRPGKPLLIQGGIRYTL